MSADAVAGLSLRWPGLRVSLAARAHDESLRLHTWDRVAERFEQVYDWVSCRAREWRGTV